MGKRSDFKRRARDFYPTPVAAVEPLIPHLPERFTYIEPCVGDGALVRALGSFRSATGAARYGYFSPTLAYGIDIQPVNSRLFQQQDAFDIFSVEADVDFFITNPPWDRDVLHPLILHLSVMRPTWLLFDGDWAHTKQAAPYLGRCRKIVAVGRVKWIAGSPHTGKDNCTWYLFDEPNGRPPEFWGRQKFNVPKADIASSDRVF